MSEMTFYKVKSITVDAPTKGSSSTSYFRTIKITEVNGNEVQISVFADDFGKLLIKKEKLMDQATEEIMTDMFGEGGKEEVKEAYKQINPENLCFTCGVMAMKGKGFENEKDDYMFSRCIALAVKDEFEKQPDECTDGGNDKHFFTIEFRGTKLFVAENEVNGLTVMLPDEY